VLRKLLDPHKMPLRKPARNSDDVTLAAMNNWVFALDNLSQVRDELSDDLCRISTGGGCGRRKLYSDDDETLFDAMRPIILTGIGDLATRDDLLDRAIQVELKPIPPESRMRESKFWDRFDRLRPKLLGALLDAVAAALRHADREFAELPRMADFAHWVMGAEPELGIVPGEFLAAYSRNVHAKNFLIVESSEIGRAVVAFAKECGVWEGNYAQLLGELNNRVETRERPKSWPTTPPKLRNAITRLLPSFPAFNVSLGDAGRGNQGRQLRLEYLVFQPAQPAQPTLGAIKSDGCAGCDGSDADILAAPLPPGWTCETLDGERGDE